MGNSLWINDLKFFASVNQAMMNNKYLKVIALTGLALVVVFSPACSVQFSTKMFYREDAEAFCAIHELDNWSDVSSEMPLSEFNQLVIERELAVVKTQTFKEIVEDLSKVNFYPELYPLAKRRIQAVTGEDWDCPAYEKFSSLVQKPVSLPAVDTSNISPDILINTSNAFELHGAALDLQSDQLKLFIASRNRNLPLIVKMEKGASNEALSLLFDYLSKLDVENILVVDD